MKFLYKMIHVTFLLFDPRRKGGYTDCKKYKSFKLKFCSLFESQNQIISSIFRNCYSHVFARFC